MDRSVTLSRRPTQPNAMEGVAAILESAEKTWRFGGKGGGPSTGGSLGTCLVGGGRLVDYGFGGNGRMVTAAVERGSVKALVCWATGKKLTDRLPKLSLITLSPPLNSGILGLRMGPYVPTPKFFTISGDPGRVIFIRFLT